MSQYKPASMLRILVVILVIVVFRVCLVIVVVSEVISIVDRVRLTEILFIAVVIVNSSVV
jgi:hypothetical protein